MKSERAMIPVNGEARRLGEEGERRVADYLRQQGYTVLRRNYKDRYGEIDIIAEKENTLVFVEVKTRTADGLQTGAQAVSPAKRERVRRTALMYISRSGSKNEPRFDVAEVTLSEDPAGGDRWQLRYIKNAF